MLVIFSFLGAGGSSIAAHVFPQTLVTVMKLAPLGEKTAFYIKKQNKQQQKKTLSLPCQVTDPKFYTI